MSEITATTTPIDGLILFKLVSHDDDRGSFQEKFQQAKLVEAGLPNDFKVIQTNVAHTFKAGTIRGIHAETWSKYISTIRGKVFSACVDVRKGPGFGTVFCFELDPMTAAYLPAGIANSYQTLEDETFYFYNTCGHWDAEVAKRYIAINPADPTLKISWPIAIDKAILSERDQTSPMLADIKPLEL